jgi:hypothetical protein
MFKVKHIGVCDVNVGAGPPSEEEPFLRPCKGWLKKYRRKQCDTVERPYQCAG